MKRKFLLAIVLLFCMQVYGQVRCGSELNLTELQQTDTARYQRIMSLEKRIQKSVSESVMSRSSEQSPIIIPVVVHIVYNNSVQNISDEQVYSQIQVLNEDYSRLNSDKANTPKAFEGIAGNANITFKLAEVDPYGQSTTGITRTVTAVNKFYQDDDGVKFYAQGGHNAWNTRRFLNIWVCNIWTRYNGADEELLGYAQFPSDFYTSPNTDGVVINYKAFGRDGSAVAPYNKGRTATHEIGHWLNLRHIWGDDGYVGCHCDGSDEVDDTPNQSVATGGCPSFPLTDCCTMSSPGVMFMNYMDYSDDACLNMFTKGQVERMRAVFNMERYEMSTHSHCFNGKQDGNETGIDCGGDCPPCKIIVIDPPETCNDGIQNQDETDIDCGGVCPPCGIGGNLDHISAIGDCECGDVGVLPVNNTNSFFSGENIFDADDIKLSHGMYKNVTGKSFYTPFYRCRNIVYYTNRRSSLDGGIFFEENNMRFSPDKMYKLSFNYWMYTGYFIPNDRRGPVHLRLANGLKNTAVKKEYHYNAEPSYRYDGYTWESPVSTMPQIDDTFYIGYIKDLESPKGCSYYNDDKDYRYAEVSIIFKPDNYYSQLWITTENNYPVINSFKIQEMCMENFVYNRNTQNINNPTRAADMIMFQDMDYRPTDAVEFIAGNTIIIRNSVSIIPQDQGSVYMRIDKSVCPNNTLRSAVIVEDSQVETLPTFLINEAETVYYDKVRLYPNPTSGIVNIITLDGVSQVKTISIYDVTGKLLKNYMNFTENRLDLFGFNDGMYFLKIRTSLGLTTHKIIIEK